MLQCLGNDFVLKLVSSEMSNATARSVYNDNFKKLTKGFDCIRVINLADLSDVTAPVPPLVNTNYVFQWDGSNYVLVSTNTDPGTKFIIPSSEYIYVAFDRQYIVKDHLFLYGTLVVVGELVIL